MEHEVLHRIEKILCTILERMEQFMANIDTFIADTTTFKTDVVAALARAQKTFDDLKAQLANATITPAQQAALDAADKAVNDADAVAKAFDIPTPPAARK
jgi:hypothetical protein